MDEIKSDDFDIERILWFVRNVVYCEDTHSFVHRLFDLMKDAENIESHKDLQHLANRVIYDMNVEYDKINGISDVGHGFKNG